MLEKEDLLQVRNTYTELIKKELLGPGSEISIPDEEHELISTRPEGRYSIGILYPHGEKLSVDNNCSKEEIVSKDESQDEYTVQIDTSDEIPESDETLSSIKSKYDTPSEEDNLDDEVSMALQNKPSSMGITFFAIGEVNSINVQISFATYRGATVPDCKIFYNPVSPDNFVIPEEIAKYVDYDKSIKCLCLKEKIERKYLKEIKDKGFAKDDKTGLLSCLYKLCDQLKDGYIREPHTADVHVDFVQDYVSKDELVPDTKAKLTVLRRTISKVRKIYSITIMLINDKEASSSSKNCLFQPEIRVSSDNNSFSFIDYAGQADFKYLDDEEQSLQLQYRNKKNYGSGLGTSVNWEITEDGKGELYSDFFPKVEVPGMDFSLKDIESVNPRVFSMEFLSDLNMTPKSDKINELKLLIDSYEKWITEQEKELLKLDSKYHAIGRKNLNGCRASLIRMRDGIDLLLSNENIWKSFQLANRAMYMQRIHVKLQELYPETFPYDEEISDILENIDYNDRNTFGLKNSNENFSWRPFQLAFLLMSLSAVTNNNSPDRNLVDLIWFPTGGGKTEAYLGLTAFTIFFRRLCHLSDSSGTTVIMRYTLRLLAAQQFTRASTLICACELIRADSTSKRPRYGKYDLGKDRITIGLWIGREHTPNKNDQAKANLEKLNDSTIQDLKENKDRYNKFQMLKCPWCGTKLVKEIRNNKLKGEFGYRMTQGHFQLYCPQPACQFSDDYSECLPVQVVDEELYLNPPTLLFGTVDKFAMLPWNRKTGNFFASNSNNRPPELIIQDELHLISGPLGTIVGLYETVVDKLCANKGVRAKIIASTATIRRAKEQCSALYNREVNQFPNPGLNAEDSFFARESVIDYSKNNYGRSYIGLMPSGKTKAMMEVRTIASLMQHINMMELSDEIKDKYWTLTVYFNSLRELGKCTTLVADDVKDAIKQMSYRLGVGNDARKISTADELTSRVSTTILNETLEKLEKREYKKEIIEAKDYAHYPSNIVLATNMISVGIDVARLNVMVIVGQPKLTSEYIQASSRVGRTYPGIVLAMYDGSKSRDRSFYEQFRSYHESFYKYVEPTGATPFSKPARDRALHAVLISLLRNAIPEFEEDKNAYLFDYDSNKKEIEEIKDFIVQRNKQIVNRLNPDMNDESDEITEKIAEIIKNWDARAKNYTKDYGPNHFYFGEKFMFAHPAEEDGRLLKAYNTGNTDQAFETLTSMRNVDSTIRSNILIFDSGDNK
mgnify:CR=1 FL=1